MKTQNSFIKSIYLKLFLIIPMVFLALVIFSLNASGQKTTKAKTENAVTSADKEVMKEGAYQKVDEMPLFPGGDTALLKYIGDSTRYPKEAKIKAIQGKVITRFMVKADGTVSDVSVLKGVDPLLDHEAARVVATLPKFTPGKLKGKNVPVWYMVPITFRLK
jgi:protein TonB